MHFIEPPWNAPFDRDEQLGAIAAESMISGMFPAPLLAMAQRRHVVLPSAREKYQTFKFYPLREHAQMLLEVCDLLFKKVPTREALRHIGTFAPEALLKSTIGRVTLGTAEGVHAAVEAMARAYEVNLSGVNVGVTESSDRQIVVRLDGVGYFLDSHHVGVFEGLLQHAGVIGTVTIATEDLACAELCLRWS